MTSFRIVSCYSAGTPYQEEAEKLRDSCVKVGVPHDIRPVEDQGSWVRNCGMKPVFLQEMMGSYRDEALVWVDADGEIVRYPEIFQKIRAHVAFRIHPRSQWEAWGRAYTGTLFLAPLSATRLLVDRWVEEQRRDPNEIDQKTFDRALESSRTVVRELILPKEYCCKFDEEGSDRAVIRHWQASRRLRALADAPSRLRG